MQKKWLFLCGAFTLFALFATTLTARIGMGDDLRPVYLQRRQTLVGKLPPNSLVLMFGRGFQKQLDKLMGRFRQNSNFYYLTGVSRDKAALLLQTQNGVMLETLYMPRANKWAEKWVGKKLSPGKEAEKITGIMKAEDILALKRDLKPLLSQFSYVYTNAQRVHPEFYEYLTKESKSQGFSLESPRKHLGLMRVVKSPEEIKLIQKAIDITVESHKRTMSRARPHMFEYQLQAEIEYNFLRRGAVRPAFSSIVGSGPNSCVLHYITNRRQTRPGELVVIDIGAEYNRYAADVTRTIPISGKFTKRQKEVYNIVYGAQKAAMAKIKPGNYFRDVHRAAVAYIDKHGYRNRFLHGTSHWLGLDVHDLGPRSIKLKPGMVLTVEPGIYIAEENLGVRIEDVVLVTKDGYKLLTKDLPRKAEEVEALMAAGKQAKQQ